MTVCLILVSNKVGDCRSFFGPSDRVSHSELFYSSSDGLIVVTRRGSVRRPDDKAKTGDNGAVVDIAVVAIASDDLLTMLQVDVAQGAISSLRADSHDARLVLIEVNVRNHLVEFDSGSNVVAPVVGVLVVVEGVDVEDDWRLLLVE